MKKVFLICMVIILALCSFAYADEDIAVYYDGEKIEFDAPPVTVNDRVLVPMRKIFETFGGRVSWDATTNTAYAFSGEAYVAITIDSEIIRTSYYSYTSDVPAQLVNDKTYVPLRAIADIYGLNVYWDEDNNAVYLCSEEYIDEIKKTVAVEQIFGEHLTIQVETAEELIANIGCNRTLVLTGDYYNLSEVNYNDNFFVRKNVRNNMEYLISDVYNLKIKGDAEIVIDSIMADVLCFENCKDITIDGITAGHTESLEQYACEGAVIRFYECENVNLINSALYGCGAFGVYADETKNINVNGCNIYDCTYTGVWFTECNNVNVAKTKFHDSVHTSGFARIDNSDVTFDECLVYNITSVYSDFIGFVDTFDSSYGGEPSVIKFTNCEFKDNKFVMITNEATQNISFTNCTFKNNSGKTNVSNVKYNKCKFK